MRRPALLRHAITSLLRQSLPASAYEIIVVDNDAAARSAAAVVAAFDDAPNLHYLLEPRLGLSTARNTGWRRAAGDYVAFLDDDAVASPDWLARILAAFDRHDPQPAVVGGRVVPMWQAPRPPWLPDNMLTYLSAVDWSDTEIALGPQQFIAGTNMAMPCALLKAVGGFPESLGRIGNRLLSNEETFVHDALRAQGHTLIYDPAISVEHPVPEERLRRGWFVRRVFWQGVSEVVQVLYQDRPPLGRRLLLAIGELGGLARSMKPARSDAAARFAWQCAAITRVGRAAAFAGLVGGV